MGVRPISPFLTIYRLQFGSFFSIFSRISGLFLIVFSILFFIIISFFRVFATYYSFYTFAYFLLKTTYCSFFLSFVVLFFLITLFYHLVSGFRYCFWSDPRGLNSSFLNLGGVRTAGSLTIVCLLALLLSLVFFLFS